ncbi:MAG: hypothetical protein A2270_00775 [Elusimicrobia bacterium RIFOXYA12_FULL_51_18]|nr:MAG: hypothetical protein A2270_00775 [Elusimicrobia bacterium RIFOXYA12_FULL_51_18]OGS29031.1 MAG: hypothetical protein A2218_08790 [Elusimicrobia bacterium RIFOXYA2_FULL_53_38]
MILSAYFDIHRYRTIIVGILMLCVVAYLDHVTGTDISFSIFYLVPVLFTAWHTDETFAIVASLIAATIWLIMDTVLGGKTYPHHLIPYWNALVRASFFLISGVLLVRLRMALRDALTSSKLKAEMMSIVSHEFNNSLVSINLASTLLEEDDGDNISEHRRKLYGILTQTHRAMTRTVKTFLANARLDAGKFTLERKPIKLREIVKHSLDIIKPLGEEKGVEIITDFPDIPIPLEADPDALSLVMGNLIGNAIKYTPTGGHIIVAIKMEDYPANMARVSIEDTGPGIDKNDLSAIFSGFYRTSQGKHAAKGFGLGLKVSRELIENHGSKLLVESTPGHGAKFYFTLPVTKVLQ